MPKIQKQKNNSQVENRNRMLIFTFFIAVSHDKNVSFELNMNILRMFCVLKYIFQLASTGL